MKSTKEYLKEHTKMYEALQRSYLLIKDYLEMYDTSKIDKSAWKELNNIESILKEIES